MLKKLIRDAKLRIDGRAFTGAWIETVDLSPGQPMRLGRAFTGAWIETVQAILDVRLGGVAPSRARGLKPFRPFLMCASVASRLHGRVD